MSRRLESWLSKGLTATARLQTEPAVDKDIDEDLLQTKLNRGSFQQRIRLEYYPSIEVDTSTLYAGTFYGSKEELVGKLFQMGYRNNPTAYVEVTDRFGPDDGSFAKHKVEEDVGFPHANIDRPLGILPVWNRVKSQTHATVYVDGDKVHILAHQEVSAPLQPVRHLSVSDSNARIGIREFKEDWFDEFGERLSTSLGV